MKNAKRTSLYYPLIAAAILRIATFVFIDISTINWNLRKPDILMEYGAIARNMLKGLGYSSTWYNGSEQFVILPSAFMPPGQTFIDYFCLAVFGDSVAGVAAIFIVNAAMGVASVYLIGRIAEALFENTRLTKITLWAAALYPPLIYTSATFGITSAVILLNAWILLSCIRFEKSIHSGFATTRRAVEIGIGFGLLFLFRGEAPLIFLVTFVYLVYTLRRQWKIALAKLTVALVITFAIVAPWTVRNYTVFDRFILTSSNGGFNFWRGNNAVTAASSWAEGDGALWTTDELWAKARPYLDSGKIFEKVFSEIYFTDALQWIQEHPGDAALLTAKKAMLLWTVDRQSKAGRSMAYMLIYGVTLAFFLLGIYRIVKGKTRSFGVRLIILWCVCATVVAMMFFPMARLQVMLVATYFPIAVYGGMFVWDRLSRQKQFS